MTGRGPGAPRARARDHFFTGRKCACFVPDVLGAARSTYPMMSTAKRASWQPTHPQGSSGKYG